MGSRSTWRLGLLSPLSPAGVPAPLASRLDLLGSAASPSATPRTTTAAAIPNLTPIPVPR